MSTDQHTAGPAPDGEPAGPDPELAAWARAWAESFPPWSDERWARNNAALGYRLRPAEGQEGE